MKVSIQTEQGAEKELIIRCEVVDEEIQMLLKYLENKEAGVVVRHGLAVEQIKPEEILYCEMVDRKVFVYTRNAAEITEYTLAELEEKFGESGFFRCSKSMIVNIHHITYLQSGLNGQLLATLTNEEKLMISRHYGRVLRKKLSR